MDPVDLVLPVGGIGGAIYAALKFSGGRNITALDSTLKSLSEQIAKLTDEVQKLREAHIGLAKDVGALQEGQRSLAGRIDGQGAFWHKQFEEFRAAVNERLLKGKRP